MISEKRITNIVSSSLAELGGVGIPPAPQVQGALLVAKNGKPSWTVPNRPDISGLPNGNIPYASGNNIIRSIAFVSGTDLAVSGSMTSNEMTVGEISYSTGIGQNHLFIGVINANSITTGRDAVTIAISQGPVTATGSGSILISPGPEGARMKSNSSIGIGRAANIGTASDKSIAIGSMSKVADGSPGAIAIGADAVAAGPSCLAIGHSGYSAGSGSTVIGTSGRASGASALAIGSASSATGDSTISIGYMSRASGSGSIAIGIQAVALSGSIAIGSGATAEHPSSYAWGPGTVTTAPKQHAIGRSGVTVRTLSSGVTMPIIPAYTDDTSANNDPGLRAGQLYRVSGSVRIK